VNLEHTMSHAAHSDIALDLAELGQRLRRARNTAGLTPEEVAQRLHLPLATVGDLEAGRSERIGTPIYLKGFLKSYLKLLELPEDWAEQALAATSVVQTPPIMPAAGAVARRVSWMERYKWAATYVVGTALVLTGVQWLVSNTPQLGFPESPRPAASVAVPVPPAAQLQVAPLVAPAPEAPATSSVAVDEATADEAPVMASLSPFRLPADADAEPGGLLELEFEQASWVEVRDRNGERLAFQTVPAGEKRTFSVGAPFSVLIGNARGVRAVAQGKRFDLEPYVRGNVARFVIATEGQGWAPSAVEREGRNGG